MGRRTNPEIVGDTMETQPLTIRGYTRLTADNGRVRVHLFRDATTGLIASGLVEYRTPDGEAWGPIHEVKPVA